MIFELDIQVTVQNFFFYVPLGHHDGFSYVENHSGMVDGRMTEYKILF